MVVVFLSVGSELYCCSLDGYIATCACHEGTGVHVHVMRGHIILNGQMGRGFPWYPITTDGGGCR